MSRGSGEGAAAAAGQRRRRPNPWPAQAAAAAPGAALGLCWGAEGGGRQLLLGHPQAVLFCGLPRGWAALGRLLEHPHAR